MIAIKNMEMPKFCGECLIGQWDDYEPLGTYCPLLIKGVDMNHKDVDCPLIEVEECEEK